MQSDFFPYSWHVRECSELVALGEDASKRETEIHVYGFDTAQNVTLLRIRGFTPYVFVKLPVHIRWTDSAVQTLVKALKKTCRNIEAPENRQWVHYKRPLYYAAVHSAPDTSTGLKYEYQPYLFLRFKSESDRRHFAYSMPKQLALINIGNLELEVYEHNASVVLQMTCHRGISTADWFHVRNAQPADIRISRLAHEYTVNWKGLGPVSDTERTETATIPSPLICSFDIECNFHDPNKFSDGSHPEDVVFQISCVLGYQGQSPEKWERHLFSLGNPDSTALSGVTVHAFGDKESKLIRAFVQWIIDKNPQILLGYNIYKFDIPFLYKRAIYKQIHDEFEKQGCTRERSKMETIKWSSSAYSNQEMNFLNLQGRLTIDLLTLVQRDFNLESYKLDTVANKFLGTGKDPLNHYDIFMCYQMGMKETAEKGISPALGLVGKYCVKDSALVLELFEKFQYWYSLTEMAKICQVPHAHLYLYGQQLKVFSQVYKYCFKENIVVESGRFKTNEDDFCTGAYVFTPEPGLYDNVVSFDFQSLYPSIIISHNIDFTTLVPEDTVSKIPSEKLNLIAWGEHVNCTCPDTTRTKDKETRCKNYAFHWLREPRGVLPTIIQNLLDARKAVRKQMKTIDPGSMLYDILNKRQLAYKVSSNSMYGALSTKKGYLPFLPAGMCVTAVGRKSIEQVSQIIQTQHQGKIVYGDSVTGETPILVRDPVTRLIRVETIASLGDGEWTPYPNFRMFDLWNVHLEKQYRDASQLHGLEVWSDCGWTPIRKVIRHKTHKKLYTVGSQLGVVCVTEDHSLLTASRQPLKPRDLRLGQKLLYAFPYEMCMQPGDLEPQEDASLWNAFRRGVHCHKRVPVDILNAPVQIVKWFIHGFKSEQFYPEFKFTDAALAQDFYILLTRIGQLVRIETELPTETQPQRVYRLIKLTDDTRWSYAGHPRGFDGHAACTTVIYEHDNPTSLNTFVYDLETECGRFQAGIGQMIVKNTDSNYVMFPHLSSLKEIWDHSVHVSDAVSKCFPEPMRLEFEEHIYARYLILSKKRYLYYSCGSDGTMSSKIENKGVLLKRRDNSKVVRDIYETLIRNVLDRQSEALVISRILHDVAELYARVPPPEAYQMSKSVKTIHNFHISYRDAKTIRYGDYVVPVHPNFQKRNPETKMYIPQPDEDAFYQSHLPGAVQLALRMRARGQHIESGSRLSYILTRRFPHSTSVADRMEEIEYFKLNYSRQMIDVLHYLHLLINPVEEVLTVMYGKKYDKFLKDQYKYHLKFNLVLKELYHRFHPLVVQDSHTFNNPVHVK